MKQLGNTKYFIGLPLLCLASSVFAGPPVNYNGWTANDGVIDTAGSCGTGITCTTMVEDAGFLIQQIDVKDPLDSSKNYTYIRYIVADPTATGDTTNLGFTAETFIPFAYNSEGMSQGIASMQIMRDTTAGFEATAELQRSMMRFSNPAMRTITDEMSYTDPAEMYTMKLSQKITDPDNNYADTFDYTHYTEFAIVPSINPDSDKVIGRVLDISQQVAIGEAIDPASKQQFFEHKRRMGKTGNVEIKPGWAGSSNYLTEGTPISKAGSLTLGGDTVSWADGDEIVSNWLVQELVMSDTNVLSHQSIENRTSPASYASETDIAKHKPTPIVTPFAWNQDAIDNFGPEPSLNLP